ncbi:hypothetical protein BC826DRAFT_62777 [Russula brevipes]|nr:hypothetical protein BC826DRAFT_62777 [Russula brevipes]
MVGPPPALVSPLPLPFSFVSFPRRPGLGLEAASGVYHPVGYVADPYTAGPPVLPERRPVYAFPRPVYGIVSAPTSQSPPPPGSAADVGANIILAVPALHAMAALDNTASSSSSAQPAAQPPRGQAQRPLQRQIGRRIGIFSQLVPPKPHWTSSSTVPKADNKTSHVDPIRPPEGLHPTLSFWLKNLKKFSSLINRLQELASAAPPDLRPQLDEQVAMLRSSFKKQQDRCVEFLRLTEEYADRYLRDISAEIQQQSSFLDMLEKRLDMAKTLHGQAMDLRKSYESGTVDTMKDVHKALLQPLPEDFDLFKEVDFVLDAIRRCYMELDKFWTEEIRRAAKALETRRVDPEDAKRWRDFKASLEQTTKSWKTTRQGSSTWSLPQLSGSSVRPFALPHCVLLLIPHREPTSGQ